jgi:predicted nucleic acid-binding protein
LECKKIDKISSLLKQAVAIISVNMLAYVYDGQFLWLAIGLDALVLGYNIKDLKKQ